MRGLNINKDGSITVYYETGNSAQVWTTKDGLNSQGDNPAEIWRDKDGNTIMEGWYKNDQLHRDGNKPARIGYKDGSVTFEAWYENGVEVRSQTYTEENEAFWRDSKLLMKN